MAAGIGAIESHGFSLLARLWAAVRKHALDARLATGGDPDATAPLQWRAQQLVGGAERERLAEALEAALSGAARAPADAHRRAGSVPLRWTALRECAPDVHALADRLRSRDPVEPCGVALTRQLLYDGAGPLYYPGPVPLRYSVRWATQALEPFAGEAAELARSPRT